MKKLMKFRCLVTELIEKKSEIDARITEIHNAEYISLQEKKNKLIKILRRWVYNIRKEFVLK